MICQNLSSVRLLLAKIIPMPSPIPAQIFISSILYKKAFISYTPITLEGTNLSWSSGFMVSKSEVFSGQNKMTFFIILICIISILLCVMISRKIYANTNYLHVLDAQCKNL